jgi:glycosyltransferase involved in cell wall biosynthesis
MACGTPVIASPEAASKEIAGDAVMRVDCTEAAFLANAIAQMVTDEALREHLTRLGRVQVQPFTIEACARATLQVYQEAFGMHALIPSQHTSNTAQSTVTATDTIRGL